MSDKYIEDINRAQLSNSQFYDKAILTLSIAGLILLLFRIQDFQSTTSLLYISLICFVIAIVTNLISFKIGNANLQLIHDNHVEGKSNKGTNIYGKINICLSWITAIALLSAVILTIILRT